MLKVLIADDEPLVRIGLKSCINWEEHGFNLIGLAGDGQEALRLIREVSPDIVITDIKMPVMDGLELLSILKKEFPQIKSIVLSCHNELEYVKQAIKLGAEDYILKLSLEPEHIVEILDKIREHIAIEQMTSISGPTGETNHERILIKRYIFFEFISNTIDVDAFQSKMREMHFPLVSKKLIAVYCEIDDFQSPALDRTRNKQQLKISAIELINDLLDHFDECYFTEDGSGKFFIVLGWEQQQDSSEIQSSAHQLCRKAAQSVKKYLDITISSCVSGTFDSYSDIPALYSRLKEALIRKFYIGNECLLHSDDSTDFQDYPLPLSLEQEQDFVILLNQMDEQGACNFIIDFFTPVKERGVLLPKRVCTAAMLFLSTLIRFCRENNIQFDSMFSDKTSPYRVLSNADTINILIEQLLQWSKKTISHAIQSKDTALKKEIVIIKQYISDHINEQISLDKAARICNINKSYLSSMFKRETGQNFTDYLNTQKMLKAKELIKEKGLKAYEAAFLVGITDESYFSKLFKKYIGIPPSSIK